MEGFLEFVKIFGGLTDAYFASERCIREPVTLKVWADHLYGGQPIGIYPLRRDGFVRWGCIDVDEQDLPLAMAISDRIPGSLIETSRSKGFHVWALFEEPQLGSVVRSKLRRVAELEGVPRIEVNPKQSVLAEGTVGNCVRLPYAHARQERRQEFMGYPCFLDFLDEPSWADLSSLGDSVLMRSEVEAEAIRARMRARGDGPSPEISRLFYGEDYVEVGERDDKLFCLAMYMHGRGLTKDEALDKMEEIWKTKVSQEGSHYSLKTALRKVERAYMTTPLGSS